MNKLIMTPPIGILITMGKEVITANGGLKSFVTHLIGCLQNEDSGYWLQKSRNCPKAGISQVYIICCNRVAWRAYYGGYSREPTMVFMLDGEERAFPYPHMILGGPIERAPFKIPMRGFQGFRYVYEPLW